MPKNAIKLAIILFRQLNFTSGHLSEDRQFTQVTPNKAGLLFCPRQGGIA
jgi:hypothetical protein